MSHWVDEIARLAMERGRTRLFPDGWGHPSPVTEDDRRIEVSWTQAREWHGLQVLDGSFRSPALLPAAARTGFVRWIRPPASSRVCLHLAASNEHGYGRRASLAKQLAASGIGSLILENPFYGRRRVHAQGPPIRTVAELLTMGSAAVQEGRALLVGAREQELGVGVAGYSMGGNIAGLIAATFPGPLVTVPMAPSPSPAPVYTEGLLADLVDWDALGGRTVALPHLRSLLDEASILRFPPLASPELAIIVAAESDAYIPRDAVESIHRHWSGSELRWRRGGHLTLATIGRRHLVRAIVDAFGRA